MRHLALVLLAACTGSSAVGPDGVTPGPDGAIPDSPSVASPGSEAFPALPELEAFGDAQRDKMGVAALSVAIVKDGELVWAHGWGLADVEAGREATAYTPYLVASVSKAVTAAAAMAAWDDGLLPLDVPVGELVFNVTHPRHSDAPITTRHLMTHSASIKDDWDVLDAGYVDGDSDVPLGEFLADYLTPEGATYGANHFYRWAPGTGSEYSNVGAALIGHVVQEVVDQPFPAWCEDRLFTPLGMDGAGWHLSDVDTANLAVPYRNNGNAVPHYGFPDYPNGSLRASAVELGHFLGMVSAGGTYEGQRLLSEAAVTEMLRPQIPDIDQGQRLIWYEEDLDGDVLVGHNGGEVGVSADMFFRPSDGVGFVVLMNGEPRKWKDVLDLERALLTAGEGL